ncbi:MAG: 4-(cytidine 5'-diphospho)-2-C-methyl-D-erythritol kinase [Flavisolibacter sp.]
MIVFPNCKINLGLHILQKRPDGFHDLETVFYPIPLQDALEIVQDPSPTMDLQFSSSGLVVDTGSEDNICVKAYRLLKKDFPGLPAVKVHLHKVIPMGAGLGGGSSNGAFTLTLLNKKFNLGLDENELINYALQLGSDCPFFIKNKPCYATGRGEKMELIELDLTGFKIILVNPGIHIPTSEAFSRIRPDNQRQSIKEIIAEPVEHWKEVLKNDFEASVFEIHPEIEQIKNSLYKEGAVYASMTGSGSSVYGLFKKDAQQQLDFPSNYFIKQMY